MSRLGRIILAGVALLVAAPATLADTIFYHDFAVNGSLWRLDTGTGVETLVGGTGLTDSWGLDFAADGTLYGYHRGNQSLYTLDTGNATPTLIGVSGLGAAESLVIDAAGRILVAEGSDIYQLDALSGAANLLGTLSGAVHQSDGLTAAPVDVVVAGQGTVSAGTLFSIDSGNLYIIDPNTFVSTSIGTSAGNETLAFGPDGTLYVHDFVGRFLTRDLATGTETLLANTQPNIVASAVRRGAVVPESGTLGLLGLGLLGLGLAQRRRAA